jgi:hypothetical protein
MGFNLANAKLAERSLAENSSAGEFLVALSSTDFVEAVKPEYYVEVSMDEIQAYRVIFSSGTFQIHLPGSSWSFDSKAPDFKVWVWMNGLSQDSGRGYWRLLEAGESVEQYDSIFRVFVDDVDVYQVEMLGFPDMDQENDDYKSVKVGIEDVGLLAENEWEGNDFFKSSTMGNYSYELVTGSEAVITSFSALAQHFIEKSTSNKTLRGFIISDNRGFLGEIIRIDPSDIDVNQKLKKSASDKLRDYVLRDDQFVVVIFEKELKKTLKK